MTKLQWRNVIKKAAKSAGTYQPYFDSVIETLAGILKERDDAQAAFDKSGGAVLVPHVTKTGGVNIEQNPALRLVNDLNRDALAYWRDLGLTPAGLKKINENALTIKRSALGEILSSLEG